MSVFRDRRDGITKSLATGRPSAQHLLPSAPSEKRNLDANKAQAYANLVKAIFTDNPYYSDSDSERYRNAVDGMVGNGPDLMSNSSAFTPDEEHPEITTNPATGDLFTETNDEYKD